MQCRAAQRLISAERDGALSSGERTALEAHVAGCPACSRAREALATAAVAWREADQAVPAPDAELAWQDIRRRLRTDGGREGGRSPAWWTRLLWAGVPAAAAAALALTVFTSRPPAVDEPMTAASWAQFVQVDAAAAAPVVTVDESSGWVVVWTGESDGGQT